MRARGFGLAEILIITALLGLLMVLALPVYRDLQGRAAVSTLQRELHNVTMAEEMYLADHGAYTGRPGELDYAAPSGMELELTVRPPAPPKEEDARGGSGGDEAAEGGADRSDAGWSGRMTHTDSGAECAVFFGRVEPLPPARQERVTSCRRPD